MNKMEQNGENSLKSLSFTIATLIAIGVFITQHDHTKNFQISSQINETKKITSIELNIQQASTVFPSFSKRDLQKKVTN